MLQRLICQIIFSDGGTYFDSVVSNDHDYLIVRQDFNNHPFWVGHLNKEILRGKKDFFYLHNNYKVKTIHSIEYI